MKQGQSSSSRPDPKVEPKTRIMNVAGVSQIGQAMGNHATGVGRTLNGASKPMYPGREGFQAPMSSCTPHKAGSQGRR